MSTTTNTDPTELEYLGVTDAELVVRMRLPTNLHQKVFQMQDGSGYQETILSKDQALKLYDHMHQALYGGESTDRQAPPEDERLAKIEQAYRLVETHGIASDEFTMIVGQILNQRRRRRRS